MIRIEIIQFMGAKMLLVGVGGIHAFVKSDENIVQLDGNLHKDVQSNIIKDNISK